MNVMSLYSIVLYKKQRVVVDSKPNIGNLRKF